MGSNIDKFTRKKRAVQIGMLVSILSLPLEIFLVYMIGSWAFVVTIGTTIVAFILLDWYKYLDNVYLEWLATLFTD